MQSLMTPETFSKHFAGFNIIDFAVRSREILYLLAREDYTRWRKEKWNPENTPPPAEDRIQKRIYPVMLHKQTEKVFSSNHLNGFDLPLLGVSMLPKEQCVGMTLEGEIYSIGSGEAAIEEDLGKRLGKNDWLHFNDQIPDPPEESNLFDDIDGFSESDIYCAGNAGNVWRFDGKRWRRLDFPSSIDLETVVCAGDGQVYISGEQGTTFKGRGQHWQRVHVGSMSLPFKDMVWHEDRVWATSGYGVWHIRDDRVERAELPDGMGVYAGNLSVGDGVLLLAGYGGAAFLRDGQWTRIFSTGAMQRESALISPC